MFKHYLLIAWRQLKRHQFFSALNMLCLAIGICFCLLIGQYILHEWQVNSGLKDVRNQYLIGSRWKVKNMGLDITTLGALPKVLKDQFPNLVRNYYRYNPVTNVVSAGDRHFQENIAIGDTSLISMYGYPLLYGDPQHPFANNSSAVITEAVALKLFGQSNALGRTISINTTTGTTQDFKVSAVLKDLTMNSVNNLIDKTGYSVFVPFEGNQYYQTGAGENDWNSAFMVGFISLQPGVDPSSLRGPIKKLIALNAPESISKNLEAELKPLNRYYLEKDGGAVEKTLRILAAVALGILLMAVINFVNIAIGTSAYRIREIGLRKVFGGRRSQLIFQHLAESLVITSLAACCSLLFYNLFRPLFSDVLQTTLPAVTQFTWQQAGLLLGLVLLVGILAGIYPAFVLSASEVTASVRGKLSLNEEGGWLRRTLLVLQYSLAVLVFIMAMTISRQVNYFFNKDLGYNRDQLMILSAYPKQWDPAGVARMESVCRDLENIPSVKTASLCYEVPERQPPLALSLVPEGSADDRAMVIPTIITDENYAAAFGIPLLEGRFFNRTGGFTPNEMVISESLMKALGWKSAVGKKLRIPAGTPGGPTELKVVGVTKNFNYSSLHEAIGPLAFIHVVDGQGYRYLAVKLQGGQVTQTIARLKDRWKTLLPNSPFEYFFMDEKFQSLYQAELRLKEAAAIATGLIGLIVLLGVFGVLALSLTKRTREIAVRKVLGAELYHIVLLFLKQYAILIAVAVAIACPLAWFLSARWLDQYAYRVAQHSGQYLLAGTVVFGISFLLISVQCLRVALANPVNSLKDE